MDWWITFDQQAADYLPDLRIEKEEPMDRHTSFRIGGPARRMAFPERGEQLVLLLDMAARCGARPLVMGNGTNLLAPDEGLDRLVIDTSAGLSRVEAGGTPGTILAEAGASLARVADFACRQGLAGLEFAHGIPGTVGGAVCMNAGAYGGEMAQVVREATLLLPEEGIRTLTGAEMAFGYRRSSSDGSPGCGGAAGGVLPDARRPGGNPGPDEGAAGKAQGQPAAGVPQRGQHLQAAGGLLRRDADRPVRPEGADGGRRPGQREACGLCHQPGRRHLRRREGADPPDPGAGLCGRPASGWSRRSGSST